MKKYFVLLFTYFIGFYTIYSQTFSIEKQSNTMMLDTSENVLNQRNPFKLLTLEVYSIEKNLIEITYSSLTSLHIEPLAKKEENLYLWSLNPNSKFVTIKDWDNPSGGVTPFTGVLMGGFNTFLQKIQK